MISANNVTLRIGKKALFEDVNIKFTEGNCYGMIGANGAGKSTFLRILSGQLEPTSGDIVMTPGQRLSFLQQDHFKYDEYQVLDTVIMGNARLYEIMKEKDAIYMKEEFTDEDGIKAAELEGEFASMDGWEAESDAANLLNGLGIETEFHYKYMKELNGAQKVKVLLAQALFGNPDILLLDEPTNHLDLDAIAWLEEFLINFENTVIVVSHDRYFLDKTMGRIFAFLGNGRIKQYEGGYTDFRNAYLKEQPVESQSVSVKKEAPVERKAEKKLLKMSYKDQREYDSIGDEIAALEDKIAALETEMAACTTDYMRLQELSDEKTATEEKLEERMERWMELSELAEEIEKNRQEMA